MDGSVRLTIELFFQLVIAGTGLFTMWATTCENHKIRRWAAVAGIIASPAWLITTWQAEQTGAFLMSFVYLGRWLYVGRRELKRYLNERK